MVPFSQATSDCYLRCCDNLMVFLLITVPNIAKDYLLVELNFTSFEQKLLGQYLNCHRIVQLRIFEFNHPKLIRPL